MPRREPEAEACAGGGTSTAGPWNSRPANSSLGCVLPADRLRGFASVDLFVDRLRFGASDGTASDAPSVRYVPSAFRGSVAVVVRAQDGTTYGLRSADCERRGGEVAGPGAEPERCDASFSQPGSDAASVFERKLLLGLEVSVRLEELAVRLRDCSRSRSRSSMISLRVRFRLFDAARAPITGGRARGVCSEVLLRGAGGGRATSFPLSFSRPVRRNAAGFTFSLSSTTTSSSSWPESVVGGVDG